MCNFYHAASLDHQLSMNSWLSKLESSGWLDHVQTVLSSASFVAQCLDKEGKHQTIGVCIIIIILSIIMDIIT